MSGHRDRLRTAFLLVLAVAAAACGESTGPNAGGGGPDTTSVDVSLSPGGSRTIAAGGTVLLLHLPATAGATEYRLALQSAATDDGASYPMELTGGTAGSLGAPSRRSGGSRWTAGWTAAAGPSAAARLRARLYRNALQRLPGGRAAAAEGTGGVGLLQGPPVAGDTIRLNFNVFSDSLQATCDPSASIPVTGVVRDVGDHVALVEDTLGHGSYMQPDYDRILAALDSTIFVTDSTYFGAPFDLDGNQRVLFVITPRVNELTRNLAGAPLDGFFLPLDLVDNSQPAPAGCPAGNGGEIVYLQAPDPGGRFADPVSAAEAEARELRGAAHQLAGLLSAEQRLVFEGLSLSSLEESWLVEGMGDIADEVVGLRRAGLFLRQGLTPSDFSASAADFSTFELPQLAQLRAYLLDPAGTRVLARDVPAAAVSEGASGYAWLLLRWLADHETADPSGELALFRALSRGGFGGLTGTANVVSAASIAGGDTRSWPELVGDFAIVPVAADSAGAAVLPPETRLASWELAATFEQLSQDPSTAGSFPEAYPLAPDTTGFTAFTFDASPHASTSGYLVLSDPSAAPAFDLRLTAPGGGAVDPAAAAQLTIVRVR